MAITLVKEGIAKAFGWNRLWTSWFGSTVLNFSFGELGTGIQKANWA